MLKFLVYFVIMYVAFVGIVFLFQRNLLYFPSPEHAEPSKWRVPDMHEITLKTKDDLSLIGWYKAPQKNKPTILYFHGNAFHLGGRGPIVRPYLDAGYGVLLLSYRGYAGNPGKPTEQGLYQDGRAAIEFIKSQQTPVNQIVLYGESLGTGVAVQMATEYPVGAVILYSPFSSAVDVGSYHYFYLPVKWLLKDRYDSVAKIKEVHSPLLIIHSENDEIIPIKFSQKLYDAANKPKRMVVLKDLGHNDYQDVSKIVMEFVSQYIS